MGVESTSILSAKNNKNEEIVIDMDRLDKCLCSLKEKRHTKMNDLKKEDKKNIAFFRECVEKTYETNNYFIVVQSVKRHFNHEEEKYNNGTVGAYFVGCFYNTNHPNNSCTPACVNAFVPDRIPGSIECKSLCIMLDEKGKYETLNSTIIGNTTVAYIYIQTGKCGKDIPISLRKYLVSKGIKQYNVMEYVDGEPNGYKSVCGFIDIEDNPKTSDVKKCGVSGYCWGVGILVIIVIVIIILLLLALFLGVSYSKKE